MKASEFFHQGKHFFLENRDGIAQYAKENFPQKCRKVIACADDAVNQRFAFDMQWDMERTNTPVVFDGEIDWLRQPADDPEWVYAFNRQHFWLCLGQAYALTKDEKYAHAFADQMCHWVDHVKRSDPKCAKAWRTIEAGLRMEYWLKAICFFEGSPALTDEVMEKFVSSMTEHAEYIMSVYDSYNLMSNWGVLANHGSVPRGQSCFHPYRARRNTEKKRCAGSTRKSEFRFTRTGCSGNRAPCIITKCCTIFWMLFCLRSAIRFVFRRLLKEKRGICALQTFMRRNQTATSFRTATATKSTTETF